MSTYAIGDVQGCYDELCALLDTIAFDPGQDQLWFVGDLVNRGPRSLDVLRFVHGLGNAAVTLLGNHDLHLLAVAAGHGRFHKGDTLDELLAAPDSETLLHWLRQRPLLHQDPDLGYVMVHAGLAPQWDLADAIARAGELEDALRGEAAGEFFAHMYSEQPTGWSDNLSGSLRLRTIADFLTRARFLYPDGRCNLKTKGALGSQPQGHLPWFDFPERRSAGLKILFGHWSALGPLVRRDVIGLDTGCLWGGCLSALKLDADRALRQVDCPGRDRRGKKT